jgi:hypothetical protein
LWHIVSLRIIIIIIIILMLSLSSLSLKKLKIKKKEMMGENWNNCDLLRATLSELVGHLGNWLRTRPVELGHVINFLYANLAFPRQSVNGSAARSMRRLCIKCGAQLGEPLLGLYDQVCMGL